MKDLICTWVDVIEEASQYFNWDDGLFSNITKARIINAIDLEESKIRSILRPYYGNDLDIKVNRFKTFNLNLNSKPDFILDENYITVNTQFTQVWKIVFTEESSETETDKVNIYPDEGSMVAGDITDTSINLTKIVIAKEAWSGYTFQKGDTLYLAQYHYETALSNIIAKAAAARLLDRTATSQLATDGPSSQELRTDVNEFLKQVTDPFSNLLEIPLKAQDLDPEPVEYNIDDYGDDQTTYLDG